MATPKSLESLLADTMETVLTDWCITRPDEDDSTKASNIVVGKPTRELRNRVVVSIHTQHPLGPGSDKDRLVEGFPTDQEQRPLFFERESTGGARVDMVIGAVQIRIKEDLPHAEALNTIGVVVDRVRKAINKDRRLRVLKDDLGNTMIWLETFRHSGHAAGGGDTSIFIRWVDWRAIVVSDNSRESAGG